MMIEEYLDAYGLLRSEVKVDSATRQEFNSIQEMLDNEGTDALDDLSAANWVISCLAGFYYRLLVRYINDHS